MEAVNLGIISLTNFSLDGVQNCSKRISLPSIGASPCLNNKQHIPTIYPSQDEGR
jgi:hypothetical protein